MAGELVCPVLQNACGNVVGNFFGGILTLISTPIALVLNWKSNVENLSKQVDELKVKKEDVEKYDKDVARKGKEIAGELKNWLTTADKLIEAAVKLVGNAEENAKKKCFFGLCLNPKFRYQLSKKAEQDSKAIGEHVKVARGYKLPLARFPSLQQEVAAPVKEFEDFNSRSDILKGIMEALQNPSIKVIGVHGMPGVGKTMMVREVKRKAEQDKLFDVVAMASVTEKVKLENVQDEILHDLGLDQVSRGIDPRDAANLIKANLIKKKKVLIILDDI